MTIKETLTEIAALLRDEHEVGLGKHEIAALLRYLARGIDDGATRPVAVDLVGEEGATSIELEFAGGIIAAYPYSEQT